MEIELDRAYLLGKVPALVVKADQYTVVWRELGRKSTNSKEHVVPTWYFRKHATDFHVRGTVEQVLRSCKKHGVKATILKRGDHV